MNWWDFLFSSNQKCAFCSGSLSAQSRKKSGVRLCLPCFQEADWISGPSCRSCGRKSERTDVCSDCQKWERSFALQANRSVVVYNEWAKEMMQLFKFRGKRDLAKPMGTWMADVVKEAYRDSGFTCVTYVPLHPEKERQRGFNQAELLAKQISRRLFLPLRHPLLRIHHSTPQSKQRRMDRLQSIRGVFQFQQRVEGETVLLVDDIYTTGATTHECANLLQLAGAKSVYSITFAR